MPSKRKKKNVSSSIKNNSTTADASTNNTNTKKKKKSLILLLSMMKLILFVLTFGIVFFPILWPYGVAQPRRLDERPNNHVSNIDKSNDSLRFHSGRLQKIIERIDDDDDAIQQRRYLKGPETIVFDESGIMYALTEEGFLVSLTDFVEEEEKNNDDTVTKRTTTPSIITAKVTVVADLGVGRPLGGKFTQDGNTLYIADAHLGLIRVSKKNTKNTTKKKKSTTTNNKKNGDDKDLLFKNVELVASRVYDKDEEKWTPIRFADDVTIGPKTGMVYFSDATDIAPERKDKQQYFVWDVLHASKLDFCRGTPTGRLLQYDPSTEEITILARNIHFANGITVGDAEETFLLLASTFGNRPILKYDIQTQTILKEEKDNHNNNEKEEDNPLLWTGFPDGVDCGADSSSTTTKSKEKKNYRCFVAIPAYIQPLLKFILTMPHPLDMWIRSLIMALPPWLAPVTKPYGGIVELNTKNHHQIQTIYQDPMGDDISTIAGVTMHNQHLYLGSYQHDSIGVFSLEGNK